MGEGDDTKFAFRSHEKFDYIRGCLYGPAYPGFNEV